MKRQYLIVAAVVAVVLVVAVVFVPGFAQAGGPTTTYEYSNGDTTIAITLPNNYSSCSLEETSDTITVTGLPDGWAARGYFNVQYVTDNGRESVQEYFFNFDEPRETGDQIWTVYYPPVTEWPTLSNSNPPGIAEIHVTPAIRVYDENGVNVSWVKSGNIDGLVGPDLNLWDVYCLYPPEPTPTPTNTPSPTPTPTNTPSPTPTPTDPPVGDQGCTPGFWKNNAKKTGGDQWVNYSPDDLYKNDVFGVGPDGVTLLDAAGTGGGGANALLRHSTAALLNASSPNVAYAYTEGEIIAWVQAAFASGDFEPLKNKLDTANNAGCPLSNNGKK
jgi:hypothetical protein